MLLPVTLPSYDPWTLQWTVICHTLVVTATLWCNSVWHQWAEDPLHWRELPESSAPTVRNKTDSNECNSIYIKTLDCKKNLCLYACNHGKRDAIMSHQLVHSMSVKVRNTGGGVTKLSYKIAIAFINPIIVKFCVILAYDMTLSHVKSFYLSKVSNIMLHSS